jgi:glycosyltransferase involved in cell wall biosynthesis
MRVLHVIPSLSVAYGGPTRCALGLVKGLAGHGVEAHVATTAVDAEADGDARAGGPTVRRFAARGGATFAYSRPLARWLEAHAAEYDLLHVHGTFAYPTLAASRAARRAARPFLVTPHGMLEPWALGYKSWKKAPYLRFVERRHLARASALHALVPQEAENLRRLGLPTNTFVLPNGIDSEEFAALPPRAALEELFPSLAGKRLILFVGRIDPKKGLDILVRALARLLREGGRGPLHLLVAGPDAVGHRATVEKLVDGLGLRNHVTFAGLLTGAAKYAALNAADVFALPSWSEGFSMAVLEALAAARPVVITHGCNFPEVGEAGGGLVIPTDEAALHDALGRILDSDELRLSMGERGRALVLGRYSWAAIAARLADVYRDILKGQRRAAAWARPLQLGGALSHQVS